MLNIHYFEEISFIVSEEVPSQPGSLSLLSSFTCVPGSDFDASPTQTDNWPLILLSLP